MQTNKQSVMRHYFFALRARASAVRSYTVHVIITVRLKYSDGGGCEIAAVGFARFLQETAFPDRVCCVTFTDRCRAYVTTEY